MTFFIYASKPTVHVRTQPRDGPLAVATTRRDSELFYGIHAGTKLAGSQWENENGSTRASVMENVYCGRGISRAVTLSRKLVVVDIVIRLRAGYE